MVTQKAISLKIDTELLEDLDKEVALGWRKRNTLINWAIRIYLEYIDTRRRIMCRGSQRERQDLVDEFCHKYFPLDR